MTANASGGNVWTPPNYGRGANLTVGFPKHPTFFYVLGVILAIASIGVLQIVFAASKLTPKVDSHSAKELVVHLESMHFLLFIGCLLLAFSTLVIGGSIIARLSVWRRLPQVSVKLLLIRSFQATGFILPLIFILGIIGESTSDPAAEWLETDVKVVSEGTVPKTEGTQAVFINEDGDIVSITYKETDKGYTYTATVNPEIKPTDKQKDTSNE